MIYKKKMVKSEISIDGLKVEIDDNIDLNNDGVVSDTEVLKRSSFIDSGISNIVQPTETGEALKIMNEDIVDKESRMSSIDMKTRLNSVEIPPLVVIDTLVSMRFLELDSLNISRMVKRLKVSLDGKGRSELRDISVGVKEGTEMKKGFLSGLVGSRNKE